MSHNAALLCYTVVAIVGIIVLVARFKLHAFLALLLASLFVGVCAGTKPIEVAKAFQEGLGLTLSSIAVVVGLARCSAKCWRNRAARKSSQRHSSSCSANGGFIGP
jgi:GntP family gluconate:H+ symporter